MLDTRRLFADITQIIAYAAQINPARLRDIYLRGCRGGTVYSQLGDQLYDAYASDKYHQYEYVKLTGRALEAYIEAYYKSLNLALKYVDAVVTPTSNLNTFTVGKFVFVGKVDKKTPVYRIYINTRPSVVHLAIIEILKNKNWEQFKFRIVEKNEEMLRLDKIIVYCSDMDQVRKALRTLRGISDLFISQARTIHFTHEVMPGVGLAVERDFAVFPSEEKGYISTGGSFGSAMTRMLAYGIQNVLQKNRAEIESIEAKGGSVQEVVSQINNTLLASKIIEECRKIKLWIDIEKEMSIAKNELEKL